MGRLFILASCKYTGVKYQKSYFNEMKYGLLLIVRKETIEKTIIITVVLSCVSFLH